MTYFVGQTITIPQTDDWEAHTAEVVEIADDVLRQKPPSRWTKGQSCTNFQIGPIKWGCSRPSFTAIISAMILSICFNCKVICFWRALICILSTACTVVCARVFAAALSFVSARRAVSHSLRILMFSDLGSCAGKSRIEPIFASITASTRSVLASLPVASANRLACRGFTFAKGCLCLANLASRLRW